MFRQASAEWVADDASRLSSAVAFYALLPVAPVIVIAAAVAAVI
jgi:uncharacterized BrkB/YihY/UPF0761 family membrane protein